MAMVEKFWQMVAAAGWHIESPRRSFDPVVEKAIQEEAEQEEEHGEKEPEPVPELPPNIRLVTNCSATFLLYVLDSALEHGYWAVGVSELEELMKQPLPWVLVLFRGGEARGYWFDRAKVVESARTWDRFAPGSPHYKVREPEEVHQAEAFRSREEVLALVSRLARKV